MCGRLCGTTIAWRLSHLDLKYMRERFQFCLKSAGCNVFIMVRNWIFEGKTQQQNRYRIFWDIFGRVYFGLRQKLGTLVWSREGVLRNGPKDEQKHESPRNFPQRPFLFNLWIKTDKCIRLKHEWNSVYITNMWNCSNYQVWEFAMAFWVRKRFGTFEKRGSEQCKIG